MAPGRFQLSYMWALIINRVLVSNIHCHHLRILNTFFFILPADNYSNVCIFVCLSVNKVISIIIRHIIFFIIIFIVIIDIIVIVDIIIIFYVIKRTILYRMKHYYIASYKALINFIIMSLKAPLYCIIEGTIISYHIRHYYIVSYKALSNFITESSIILYYLRHYYIVSFKALLYCIL